MRTCLLSLTFFIAAANAGLILNDVPKHCSYSLDVLNGISYEKSLCYIKWDITYYQASEACKKQGMKLYEHDSSKAATKTLFEFGLKVLKNNSNAKVYISGQKGNSCLTLEGDNTFAYVPCRLSNHFVCEVYKQPTYRQCEFYDTFFYEDRYISSPVGFAPQGCNYGQPINDQRTVVTVSSGIAKETIVELYLGYTSKEYLPINAGSEFPNLNILMAGSCKILSISNENFVGMTKLRYIELDSNQITTLTRGIFDGLTSIERIGLAYNPIIRLSAANIFEGLNTLHTVYLDETDCTEIRVEDSTSPIVVPGTFANTCTII